MSKLKQFIGLILGVGFLVALAANANGAETIGKGYVFLIIVGTIWTWYLLSEQQKLESENRKLKKIVNEEVEQVLAGKDTKNKSLIEYLDGASKKALTDSIKNFRNIPSDKKIK